MEFIETISTASAYVSATAVTTAAAAKAAGVGTFMAAGVTPILNLGGAAAAVTGSAGFVAGSTLAASALIALPVVAVGAGAVALATYGVSLF